MVWEAFALSSQLSPERSPGLGDVFVPCGPCKHRVGVDATKMISPVDHYVFSESLALSDRLLPGNIRDCA